MPALLPFNPRPLDASNTPTQAQWTWDTTTITNPKIVTFSGGTINKTTLVSSDLVNFIGVPISSGNPLAALSPTQINGYIRQAEDWVEQQTSILLCPTWVASPPVRADEINTVPLKITSPNPGLTGQQLGIDYDLIDIGHDFIYRRFLMQGWGVQQLRYRPIHQVYNASFVYPLLSEFFIIPLSWVVQDYDTGLVRFVPSANVQMLPLFAMQLAFMGFAQTLPQALRLQYVAGLHSWDYTTRFSFMTTLVLTVASIYALNSIQGSVNFGLVHHATNVDGLRYEQAWSKTGAAYDGVIKSFEKQRDELLKLAKDAVAQGPVWTSL